MSAEPASVQDPGTSGVLQARLTHLSPEEFAEQYWARKPLLTRRASDFADLFSADAVDELVSRRGLRTPFLRVAKNGATLPDSSFTSGAGVGAAIADQLDDTALWRHFADGATLVLQALQRTWAPVASLTSDLSSDLGHPVQANAYITPPQNRGFDDHYDVHDVFVLQIAGSKRWVIHEPVVENPMRDQPWTDHRAAVAEAARQAPVIDTVLEPGDVLYLPRGWLHAAQAQGEVSIHLTLGIHIWTQYALAEQLVQQALTLLRDDAAVRATLPLGSNGFDDPDLLRTVRDCLVEAVEKAEPAPAFHRARRGQSRPGPLGPLAQLAAVRGLEDATRVQLRAALQPRFEDRRLHTRVGWLDFAASEVAVVERLLDGGRHRAGDLGLALTERLLRAGVLVPSAR